jgi:phage-related protein
LPKIEVIIFAKTDGSSPFLQWLDMQPSKIQDKCIVFIERLKEYGYELRRPQVDYLKDGIYELRVIRHGINYRILYFFNKRQAIISHGFVKKTKKVSENEINTAINNRIKFLANTEKHTYKEE